MTVRLPRQLGETLSVVGAVLAGAALVTVCLVLAETGWRSAPPAERLAGVDLVVGGEQTLPRDEDFDVVLPEHVGVPADLIDELSDVPGVAAVAGDLGFPAAVMNARSEQDPTGDPRRAGHSWNSLLGTVDLSGAPPAGPGEVVLAEGTAATAGASAGDQVEVMLRGQPRTLTVTGVADLDEGVFVDEATALGLSGRPADSVDLVSLRIDGEADLDAVADRVETMVEGRDLMVGTGDDIGRAERPEAVSGTGMLMVVALSAGGVVIVLVGFITAGAVSVAVANRSRDLALLRAIGATSGQIRSITARQLTGVGLVAAMVGIVAGYLLAEAATGLLTSAGMLADGQSPSRSPAPALVTVLLFWVMIQIAARAGSWRVSRLPATEAIVETSTEPRGAGPLRTRIGLVVLCLSLGSVVAPLATRSEAAVVSASSGTLLAVIGVALVAPAVVSAVAGWLAPRTGVASRWLAVRNSGSYALRTGGAIAVLTLAVGLVLTQVYASTTMSTASEHEAQEGILAETLVTASGSAGIAAGALDSIAEDSSVDAAVPAVRSLAVRTDPQHRRATAEAQPMLAVGSGADEVLDLDVADGDLRRLTGATVAVDSTTAWLAGIAVGDDLPLVLADGTEVEPTVVATYRRGFGFGKIVASLDLLPQHAKGPYDAVLVSSSDPAPPDLSARLDPWDLRTQDTSAIASGLTTQDPSRWLNLGASVVLMGYVLLGVANRLIATTLRRRREWRLLGAIGVTPRQLRAMARTETMFVCVGAVGVGLLISLVPMTLVGLGFVGRPWPQGPAWTIGAVVLTVCLVAYAATMLPVRRLLSSRGRLPGAG